MQLGVAERGFKHRPDCAVQAAHSLLSRKACQREKQQDLGDTLFLCPASSRMQCPGSEVVPGWAQTAHGCPAAAAGNGSGAGALVLAAAEPLGPLGLLVVGPSQGELERGRGQPWHCQHDSAPPQASGLRRSPPFSPSVASNRPGHQLPRQEQKVPGPMLGGLSEAVSCRGSGAHGSLHLIGLSQRPIGNPASPERNSMEAGWLPSQPTPTSKEGGLAVWDLEAQVRRASSGPEERHWSPTEIRAHPKAPSHHHKGRDPKQGASICAGV